MRKKIRSIHIILFVMLFLVGNFIDISTIHAEAGSRTGKPDKPNTIQKIINTVKTGDTTNIVAWFLIAIVSLVLIVGLYKKRKMK